MRAKALSLVKAGFGASATRVEVVGQREIVVGMGAEHDQVVTYCQPFPIVHPTNTRKQGTQLFGEPLDGGIAFGVGSFQAYAVHE